ncbi:DUF2325 domain-containing protein [Mitsuaria sp. WAJ17]|uniref:DUF2325 domain-containing protein n=1 Tax=Mitsuaria sp. WAJ17 TaxID=2761452 RepID=UPI0016003045|nr:DUF2325 domain-containing protein [Mitsuaria sp. WAJ17]MBB2484278.1 DUF2325 domain-containing protein [Mitsuaria sp. WAJ17]
MCEPTFAPRGATLPPLPQPQGPEPRDGHEAPASLAAVPPELTLPNHLLGSRRRRLWELPSQALCPVIGACLPLAVLRKRVGKALGGEALVEDYELHCGAIHECRQRGRIAELLHRELDQRYALAVRQASRLKTTLQLRDWWREAAVGAEVAGALWATLSHPRCDGLLQDEVLQDIHMIQHQVGSSHRADLQRIQALAHENGVLASELGRAQQRSTQLIAERDRRIEELLAQQVRHRAELVLRDSRLDALQNELDTLNATQPALRQALIRERQLLEGQARIHQLEQALQRLRRELRQAQQGPTPSRAADPAPAAQESGLPGPPVQLEDQSVLCVGGRAATVPVYRQLIEARGARFLHHDGGEEHAVTQLDATLAAADLVICQTACISHDAYWRVKEHCKRHGKRCVFVDQPSRSGLVRALSQLAGPAEPGTPAPIPSLGASQS